MPAAFPSKRDGISVYHANTSGLGHDQNSWTQDARYVTVDALWRQGVEPLLRSFWRRFHQPRRLLSVFYGANVKQSRSHDPQSNTYGMFGTFADILGRLGLFVRYEVLASSTWYWDVLVRCVADTGFWSQSCCYSWGMWGCERNVGIKVLSCVMFIYCLVHRLWEDRGLR